MPTKTAAIYVRARENAEEQLTHLKEFALRNNFAITAIYVDSDPNHSGLSLTRPALMKLCDESTHGKFETIIIKSMDRLTRDMFQFMQIKKLLAANNVTMTFSHSTREESSVVPTVLEMLRENKVK